MGLFVLNINNFPEETKKSSELIRVAKVRYNAAKACMLYKSLTVLLCLQGDCVL